MTHEQTLDAFDEFITKWCGTSASHLLDTDENDGERFRELLLTALKADRKAALQEAREAVVKQVGHSLPCLLSERGSLCATCDTLSAIDKLIGEKP